MAIRLPTSDGRNLRWRTLFRSDALNGLTAVDVARFRGELGMTDIIDLREGFELTNEGRGPLESETIAFVRSVSTQTRSLPQDSRASRRQGRVARSLLS